MGVVETPWIGGGRAGRAVQNGHSPGTPVVDGQVQGRRHFDGAAGVLVHTAPAVVEVGVTSVANFIAPPPPRRRRGLGHAMVGCLCDMRVPIPPRRRLFPLQLPASLHVLVPIVPILLIPATILSTRAPVQISVLFKFVIIKGILSPDTMEMMRMPPVVFVHTFTNFLLSVFSSVSFVSTYMIPFLTTFVQIAL